MQNNLFNSTFEVELRILCLLGSGRKPVMSLERIVQMDYVHIKQPIFIQSLSQKGLTTVLSML